MSLLVFLIIIISLIKSYDIINETGNRNAKLNNYYSHVKKIYFSYIYDNASQSDWNNNENMALMTKIKDMNYEKGYQFYTCNS